jgi:hypothetical protein
VVSNDRIHIPLLLYYTLLKGSLPFKGAESRDTLLPVFFVNHLPLGS